MAEFTIKRYGELSRGVHAILANAPEGLPASEALARVAKTVPPTSFKEQNWPRRPGVRRFEKVVRFATIAPVKAGWLVKAGGTWTITPLGSDALAKFTDPEVFYREARKLYRAWKKGRPVEASLHEEAAEETAGVSLEEARDAAWEEVRSYLATMPPYDFQQLVGALLRAMGYYVAWIAPPGSDGGIDILAFADPLGAQGPRIKVQVKRQAGRVNSDGLRAFMGILGDDDIGIFVSLGGFTGPAEREARHESKRKVTLIDLAYLYDLWVQHQGKVPEEHRRLLPLTAVYYLDQRE